VRALTVAPVAEWDLHVYDTKRSAASKLRGETSDIWHSAELTEKPEYDDKTHYLRY